MKTYIGVKLVQAEPAQKDGKDGYTVCYPKEPGQPEGYTLRCPNEVFEAHNRETSALPFSLALEAVKDGEDRTGGPEWERAVRAAIAAYCLLYAVSDCSRILL